MPHLKKEIKDEKEGAAHYRDLARRADRQEHDEEEDVLEKMAEDESRHAKKLEELERHEKGTMAPVDVPGKFKNIIKR